MAPILVDIAPNPAVQEELATILIEACSRAAGGDGCVRRDPRRPQEPATALVVVWPDGPASRRLRVDVASPDPPHRTLRSRVLAFRDADPLPDRYRAAGLAAAALAADRPPQAKPPATAEVGESPPRGVSWSVSAGALAGSGLERQPPRAGLWATAAVPAPRSGFFATLTASYATASREPSPGLSVQWLTLGGGGGFAAPIAPLDASVRLRVEGFSEWTLLSARDPARERSDSKSLWGIGARSALDVVWPTDRPLALVGGADAFLRNRGAVIRVRGKPGATLPMGGFTGMIGLQLTLR